MTKAKEKTDQIELVKEKAIKLLELMGLSASIDVEEDKENEALSVNVEAGEGNGLLIGRRGETISSLQFILAIALKNEAEDFPRILVNVGDWRQKQEDYLKSLAEETVAKVKETGEDQPIYNLTPSQRRIVHLYLSKNKEVLTESTGEGEDRYIVVKPKS